MSYSVDYTADWASVDGVEDASYTPVGGSLVTGVKVRRGSLTRNDLAGGTFSVAPGTVVFVVWKSTLGAAAVGHQGVLLVGSVSYRVLNFSERADGAQIRVFCQRME